MLKRGHVGVRDICSFTLIGVTKELNLDRLVS